MLWRDRSHGAEIADGMQEVAEMHGKLLHSVCIVLLDVFLQGVAHAIRSMHSFDRQNFGGTQYFSINE